MNMLHPEQQEDEVYLGLVLVGSRTDTWKTSRLGNPRPTAIQPDHVTRVSHAPVIPWFIKRSEVEAEIAMLEAQDPQSPEAIRIFKNLLECGGWLYKSPLMSTGGSQPTKPA